MKACTYLNDENVVAPVIYFDTFKDMQSFNYSIMEPGTIIYCAENEQLYVYDPKNEELPINFHPSLLKEKRDAKY